MANSIITPTGKSSQVWKYFEYKQGDKDGKKVTCKVCVKVVHGGRTTNLKMHLRTWHRSTYDKLFQMILKVPENVDKLFFCTAIYLHCILTIGILKTNIIHVNIVMYNLILSHFWTFQTSMCCGCGQRAWLWLVTS